MKRIFSFLIISLSLSSFLMAVDFGANGALNTSDFTLEEMLKYAIEDEYLALNEYEALVETFGDIRPYSNIIESEKTHIKYLNELYNSIDIEIPNVNTNLYIYIPETLEEAAKIGVNAEILNISMYDKFLKQDLPSDVREVFEFLKKASENHLRAFERQVSRGRS